MVTRALIRSTFFAVTACWLTSAPASADPPSCSTSAAVVGNGYGSAIECTQPAEQQPPGGAPSTAGKASAVRYEWRLACGDKTSATDSGSAQPCSGNTGCPPKQHLYGLWQVAPPPERPLGIICASTAPATPAAGLPQLTPAMVARAFEKVPLPALATHIQPGGKTLVNFDTIFFTRAASIDRTLVLLGQQVRLAITPAAFTWSFGDGATQTTATPGAAYPAKDVVHRYQRAHATVGAHVTVTWTARFRTTGGWHDVPGSVTTVGPDTALRIAEATPALSGRGH